MRTRGSFCWFLCLFSAAVFITPSAGLWAQNPIFGGTKPAEAPPTEAPPAESQPGGRPKRVVKLPAAIDDLVLGGSGKYVIAQIKSLQQLAILDVQAGKVVKFLPTPAGNILFAAGAEKLFVVLPEQSLIQRWSLATFEREVTSPLPSDIQPGTLTMGHAAAGPLLIGPTSDLDRSGFKVLNPKTLQPLPAAVENKRQFEAHSNCVVRASANGQVFTSWRMSRSPAGFYTLLVGSGQPETNYAHESLGLLLPSADGERIYTNSGVYSNKTTAISATRSHGVLDAQLLIPSVTGNYYLRVTPGTYFRPFRDVNSPSVAIHLAGDVRPIATLNDVLAPRAREVRASNDETRLHADKRLMFFPELSSLAVLTDSQDTIDLYTIDLDQELEKSGVDYLYVSSVPPVSAEPGKLFEYQMQVKSKKGGVKISVSGGPVGMKATPGGKLTWQVPDDGFGTIDTIVSITDASDQQIFHTFRLNLGEQRRATGTVEIKPPSTAGLGAALTAAAAAEENTPPADIGQPAGSTDSLPPSDSRLPALFPSKINSEKAVLKLPASAERMELGGAGRYWIAHLKSLRKLAVIDLCEAKIAGYIPAEDNNVSYTVGATKLVMILGDKGEITRWDVATQQRELAAPYSCLTPYAAMGCTSHGPVLTTTGTDRSPKVQFLDLARFKPIDYYPEITVHDKDSLRLTRVSADGRTFLIGGQGGQGLRIFDGVRLEPRTVDTQALSSARIGIPNFDGQIIYCGLKRYSSQMRLLSGSPQGHEPGIIIPATHGAFYLTIPIDHNLGFEERRPHKAFVHLDGNDRPLAVLDGVVEGDSDVHGNTPLPLDKRIAFVPGAKIIAALGDASDAIELRRFDLDEALEKSGVDYLFVASRPPTIVKPGETVNYQIEVKSKKGGVKYRLDSGPQGMKLTANGLLTWQAPAKTPVALSQSVIVSIHDAGGQEAYHAFPIAVEAAKPQSQTAASSRPSTQNQSSRQPSQSVPTTADPDPFAPLPAAVGAKRSSLIGQMHTWTESGSGRTLEARFQGLVDGKVKVTDTTGRDVQISLDRLSREDLIWLLNGSAIAP